MTRIFWSFIKKELILPCLDLPIEYYDLDIESRDKTDDQITIAAAEAIKNYGVGLSVQPLPLMKPELKNLICKECIVPQMGLSVTF